MQNKIEKVTRRAQEQFQMVLEEQSRFSFQIVLPKVLFFIFNISIWFFMIPKTSSSLLCALLVSWFKVAAVAKIFISDLVSVSALVSGYAPFR